MRQHLGTLIRDAGESAQAPHSLCLPAVLSSTRQRVGVSALAERAPLIGTLWDNSKMTLGDLV